MRPLKASSPFERFGRCGYDSLGLMSFGELPPPVSERGRYPVLVQVRTPLGWVEIAGTWAVDTPLNSGVNSIRLHTEYFVGLDEGVDTALEGTAMEGRHEARSWKLSRLERARLDMNVGLHCEHDALFTWIPKHSPLPRSQELPQERHGVEGRSIYFSSRRLWRSLAGNERKEFGR